MASKRKFGTKRVLKLLDSHDERIQWFWIWRRTDCCESEQEWSSSDENGESDAGDFGEKVICAKSGKKEWKEIPFHANVLSPAKNLVNGKPGHLTN